VSQIVTGIDLRDEREVAKAQPGNELLGKGPPVDLGRGDGLGCVRPRGTRELAGEFSSTFLDPAERVVETGGVDRRLLAEGRRRRGLTVGACEHRDVAVLARQIDESLPDGFEFGE
jgi:hypothetical protein